MTFDIRKLAIGATAIMPVCDVDGVPQFNDEGQPLGIEFYGPGSVNFMRARHELQEKRRKLSIDEQRGKEVKRSPDDDMKDTAELLTKLTKRLVNFDFPGGPKALYEDLALGHIAEDGDKYVGKRGNFKLSSAPDSSNTSDTQPG